MLESKDYNFDILFEKIEEAKTLDNNLDLINYQIVKDVDKDIESLRGYIKAVNEFEKCAIDFIR
jgi:hypothetical protein